jgi:biofilm PGA synthesis N-glycosyltransferase PgaC
MNVNRPPAYVVVTPVRDEQDFIGQTIATMRAQSHLPTRWVIVDDGSSDATPAILAAQTLDLPWVSVLTRLSAQRRLGSAEIEAFLAGVASLPSDLGWDYVAKLDADVSLEPDYFERLLEAMAADPRWGIASGVYCEQHGGRWATVRMPAYHAAGASKTLRRRCYGEIGGFVPRKGWDTVDEIRATRAGWRTGHVESLVFRHLKPEGAAMGALATHRFHGEICYQTGADAGFVLFKALHRMATASPRLAGGLAMLWGYAVPLARRHQRLVTPEEARTYRAMLRARLAPALRAWLGAARQRLGARGAS